MNGIIYVRVSSKEQVEGTSLESQAAACLEYARSKNINILKTFVEQGESAKFADRTALLALIDFCKENKGRAQVLLVWKIDRFARNASDHFNIKAVLMKYGLRVVSVTEPIDENPEGRLLETILAGFAQFDNDIRAIRTVQGMRRKLAEGIHPWGPPLGYTSSVTGDEKKTLPDKPNQPLFGLLQRAWRDFASGSYSMAEMGRLMTSRGILTAKGRPLSPQSLNNLLTNSYYAGVLVDPWTGEEHEGKHVPMVSRDDFTRVQRLLSGRNHSHPNHKERIEFPLRGVVRCPTCHWYMTSGFSRGRSKLYPYYCCRNRECDVGGSYSSDAVHEEFREFLVEIAPMPEMVDKLGDAVLEVSGWRLSHGAAEKAQREEDIERLEHQRRELIRMRMENLITDQEFVGQREHLTERRLAIDARLRAPEFDLNEIRNNLDKIKEPLANLRTTWEAFSPGLQRRFNQLALPVGFVHGQIGTADTALIFRTFGGFARPNSSGVPPVVRNLNQIMQEIMGFAELFRNYHAAQKASAGTVQTFSSD